VAADARAAMTASSTVSLTLSRARVPKDRVLLVQTKDEARAADAAGTLNQAPCSLGAAAAAAKLLDARAAEDPGMTQFAHALRHEIDLCDVEAGRRQDIRLPRARRSAGALRRRRAPSPPSSRRAAASPATRSAARPCLRRGPQTTALRKATLTRLLGGTDCGAEAWQSRDGECR
jgi:hypothetical protein